MGLKEFFKQMYFDIWQSNDLNKFDDYYARDFQETIQFSDDDKQPVEFNMGYNDLVKQAKKQAERYQDTTFEIKKFVASDDNHISVHFSSRKDYQRK